MTPFLYDNVIIRIPSYNAYAASLENLVATGSTKLLHTTQLNVCPTQVLPSDEDDDSNDMSDNPAADNPEGKIAPFPLRRSCIDACHSRIWKDLIISAHSKNNSHQYLGAHTPIGYT